MAVLDFTEIAKPTQGGRRDEFELFVREFLAIRGYTIAEGPDRGADGGRDIIAEESRRGITGVTVLRWLVSCKHLAHSGAAVGVGDEHDIVDRVSSHGCNGFMGAYSTLPSGGLAQRLAGYRSKFETFLYDREIFERELLGSDEGLHLAKRFFPRSMEIWLREYPTPAEIFEGQFGLPCCNCGAQLLDPRVMGIVSVWKARRGKTTRVSGLYWACKGPCDEELRQKYAALYPGHVDGWEDISALTNPTIFIRWVMVSLNRLQGGYRYSPEAFKANRDLIFALFPHVSRHPTTPEGDEIARLAGLPVVLGGFSEDLLSGSSALPRRGVGLALPSGRACAPSPARPTHPPPPKPPHDPKPPPPPW